jgi:hypothetical protein
MNKYAKSYSDATPGTALTYDALLRPATASNTVAAYAYANDALGTATNETVTLGGTVATLARGMDYHHRLAELRSGGAAPVYYAYDSEKPSVHRLHSCLRGRVRPHLGRLGRGV